MKMHLYFLFKAIAKNVNGGIGSQATQIAMMSFARWSRTQFDFDTYENADDMTDAMSKAIYHGGHRSKIGQALIEANAWMFQQSEGQLQELQHDILRNIP